MVPNSNELVDISFPLEEVASDKFEISGGWGSNMFVGSVGVQLNNVSLKNFFKGSEWRPYPHGQNQQLAIRGQTNGSYYKAISLNFTEPWLGGKKPKLADRRPVLLGRNGRLLRMAVRKPALPYDRRIGGYRPPAVVARSLFHHI